MRPPSNLAAIFVVAFCAATVANDDGTSANPKLPQLVMPKDQDWYGAVAKRDGLEGRVLVAFYIAADGHAKNASVIWAENSVLEANTLQLLKTIRFKVPTDWGTADVWRRWR